MPLQRECAKCGQRYQRPPSGIGLYCSQQCANSNPSRINRPYAERFWSRVDRSGGPDACWPRSGSPDRLGYTRFSRGRAHKSLLSHRVAWELAHGAPPAADQCVLHDCDNPPCVNPAHLWLGTRVDNNADMRRKGREAGQWTKERAARGAAVVGAKLTEDIVRNVRACYAAGGCTLQDLATELSVNKTTIHAIVRRKTWSHI